MNTNKLILAAAISTILAGTSGCARLSPSFDTNYQDNVNTISAVRLSRDSDKRNPFDITKILTRPSAGEPMMSQDWADLRNVRWDVAGDAAVRLVSQYSYADLKNAMAFMSPPDVIGNSAQNIAVDRYLHRAELGLRVQCQDADALYQGSCKQEQEKLIAQSAADGGGSLLAKYNTTVLAHKLTAKLGGIGKNKSTLQSEGESRAVHNTGVSMQQAHKQNLINNLSYTGVRYQESPDYTDNIKRIMAYAILLSAYEDANGGNIDIGASFSQADQKMSPADEAELRRAQAEGRMDEFLTRYNAAQSYRKTGRSLRQWLWENSGFAFLNDDFNTHGAPHSSYGAFLCSQIPFGKEELKMLATGRKYLKGPNLNRVINQEGAPLHERRYLGESFDTFVTNPGKHGFAQFMQIIAPRDSSGFASYGEADPAGACASSPRILAKNHGQYAVSGDVRRSYFKQWFELYEKQRTSYRFR